MLICLGARLSAAGVAPEMDDVVPVWQVIDTIPIEDRYGDFITNGYYNPFDIKPSIIEQKVEYDFEAQKYVVMEKIGDEYYRTPTYLTLTEYLEWQEKQQEQNYFDKLAGNTSRQFTSSLQLDPMAEIDVSEFLIDRMFGGDGVDIKPTGNVDFSMGGNYSSSDNPEITQELRSQFIFPDPSMDINVGVEAKIGEKLNLGFNYNSNASFDFDNKLNLGYGSDLWDEDDIIKNIEAGDIDFIVPGQLIRGQQNLFGIKTDLQFGKFWLSAVASQSRTERKSITLENGKLIQDFEIYPDNYDENRHFFLSHYFRDNYNAALANIPQINSLVQITNIEVWKTNDINNDLSQTSQAVAIDFLGESDIEDFSNQMTDFDPYMSVPNGTDINGNRLPSNENSALFETLVNDPAVREYYSTNNQLTNVYKLRSVQDFETANMRKLSPTEYTYHPQLGTLSLSQRLMPNEVLAVAYEYTYTRNGSKVYKVGQMTNETTRGAVDQDNNPKPQESIVLKMLKSSNQQPNQPSWDLMMKNVYSLNAGQVSSEDFQFDILFQDNTNGSFIRYIPEQGFRDKPLLNLFGLDRLNIYGDPQQDGVFDFLAGVTINERTGSVIFPVLEPFGESLRNTLGTDELYAEYGYATLYDNTVTQARQNPENNRFVMRGQVKSNFSSEISLGIRVPPGSLIVRAGSQVLVEGIDYDVDYGAGRIIILNDAYIQQGVPINIDYEDQEFFNLQQKTMIGLRGEYRFNDNFTLGGTYMSLVQRPFTSKVDIGEDPISNKMYGLDLNFSTAAPGVTRFLDRLPLLETDAESSFSISGEFAALTPGSSGAINNPLNDKSVVSIDDFDAANTGLPLTRQANDWVLASPDGIVSDSFFTEIAKNFDRALISWNLSTDNRIGLGTAGGNNQDNPYTRRIDQTELFDRQIDPSQLPDLRTMDITFYPDERGPYNFDRPEIFDIATPIGGSQTVYTQNKGVSYDRDQNKLVLNEPENRWGGIMTYLNNNDFEAANYEYIEFWMLNPYMDTDGIEHVNEQNANIKIQLGSVSEDILPDGYQFYENALPSNDTVVIPEIEGPWGTVPLVIPNINGFNRESIAEQDVGLDGLTDDEERAFYSDYIESLENAFGSNINISDVANDNFVSYFNEIYDDANANDLRRYKFNNNPQGNTPIQTTRLNTGRPDPDAEDLNGNRSLETNEAYYEYNVSINNKNGEVQRGDKSYITEVRELRNGEKWYRFQIPLNAGLPKGGINGFRSVQFLRMYFTGFETQTTFRFADFELKRSAWRRLLDGKCDREGTTLTVGDVGIQENRCRSPFQYVRPPGVAAEIQPSNFANITQPENALTLEFENLSVNCDAMVTKLTRRDLNRYDRLQMFVHGEAKGNIIIEEGDVSLFIRLGKDFLNNYYEYEIPVTFSDTLEAQRIRPDCDPGGGLPDAADQSEYQDIVWPAANYINIPLDIFRELKLDSVIGAVVHPDSIYETTYFDTTANKTGIVRIKGRPSLGQVKGIVIGVRNTIKELDPDPDSQKNQPDGQVWVNELRLEGLSDRGGIAATVRADLQLADFGNITTGLNYQTIGFGQIEESLQQRSLEQSLEFDIATRLELGKLFPEKWALNIPFYYQYATSSSEPLYDPFELDLTKEQLLNNEKLTEEEKAEVEDRFKKKTTITTYNFTNVRKNKTKKGTSKPWDVSNLTASYSYTKVRSSDPVIREDVTEDQRGELTYNYSAKTKPIQPFKGIKSKGLRFIREFNFNPVPTDLSFSTQMNQFKNRRLYRLPDPSEGFEYVFDDQRFSWDRNYSLGWQLAKSLKLSYNAIAKTVVDELKQVGVAPAAAERPWVDIYGNTEDPQGNSYTELINSDPNYVKQYRNNNIRDFGRMKNYYQDLSLSYNIPFKYLPGLDWITGTAQYNGDYTWSAGSLTAFDQQNIFLGNIIQNNQTQALRANMNFEKLYDKVGYFRKLMGKRERRSSRRSSRRSDADADEKKSDREISTIEKLLVRPLLSIQSVKFNYSNSRSTVIPGYNRGVKLFGVEGGQPGWDFVFGGQPNLDNFYQNVQSMAAAGTDTLLSASIYQNQQVLQNTTQDFKLDVDLEPWKDFNIELDFKKTYTDDHAEYIVNTADDGSVDFRQSLKRDVGGFDMTYSALSTLFDSDLERLFDRFEAYRTVISRRLPNAGVNLPHEIDQGFAQGYGRQHVDVLIPAFIAAYTNRDPSTIALDLREEVRRSSYIPRPNWRLNYNGLADVAWFKDHFKNITITHGYKSTLGVAQFQTDLQYADNLENTEDPFFIDPSQTTRNYFARFEIPQIVIDERFEPIIGLQFQTSSNLTFNLDYAKSRRLELSTILGQLDESRTTSFTFGLGWIGEDVNIGFLTGKKRKARRAKRNTDPDNPEDAISGRGGIKRGGVTREANRFEVALDVRYARDRTFFHQLDQELSETAKRGLKNLTISPRAQYDVNKNFQLSLEMNYSTTRPELIGNGQYNQVNIDGALIARFILN